MQGVGRRMQGFCVACFSFLVSGLGFGFRFRVSVSGFMVSVAGFMVSVSGLMAKGHHAFRDVEKEGGLGREVAVQHLTQSFGDFRCPKATILFAKIGVQGVG